LRSRAAPVAEGRGTWCLSFLSCSMEGDPDDDMQCTICYEQISEAIHLPCRCKADYCAQCWDKALAKSFNSCAKARCPTCRAPVRVDFDETLDRLVFSAESADEDADSTRARLALQLRPVQVRMLKDFGSAHPIELPAERAAQQLEKSEVSDRSPCQESHESGGRQQTEGSSAKRKSGDEGWLVRVSPMETEGSDGDYGVEAPEVRASGEQEVDTGREITTEASSTGTASHTAGPDDAPDRRDQAEPEVSVGGACSSSATPTMRDAAAHAECLNKQGIAPLCVCGSPLELITLKERYKRFLQQADAWRVCERFAPYLQHGVMRIICDLCTRSVNTDDQPWEGVWVCVRGDSTIKHATSNDICTRCFVENAWPPEDLVK